MQATVDPATALRWRKYQAIKRLGLAPSEIEAMSAVDLDWLLVIDREVERIEADAARKAADG